MTVRAFSPRVLGARRRGRAEHHPCCQPTSRAFSRIEAAIAGREVLVAGGKKDVVVGPKLDGTRVAIYSTPFSGAGPLRAPGNHQPYYVGHTVPHVDYSHAVRLVRRTALLDGLPVDLLTLFSGPAARAGERPGAVPATLPERIERPPPSARSRPRGPRQNTAHADAVVSTDFSSTL